MTKRDPYNHKNRWQAWKTKNKTQIAGITKENSDLILRFLFDMEVGINVAPVSRKGERSCCRLLALKSRLIFFAEHFHVKPLNKITREEIHQFIFAMRQGGVLRKDGKAYTGVSSYVKDFKTFWSWLIRTGKATEDITSDLRRSDDRKPPWVFLTEEEFRTMANQANFDYRALIWFMYDTGIRVTEAYSIQIKDFSDDFTKLDIKDEVAKTFGRKIKLKLCSALIKEYVDFNKLESGDYLFIKEPATFNKYLRELAKRVFGSGETSARKAYDKMSLYAIRHNASCYWLKRYPTSRGIMYRLGWSEEKEIRYYSEFLGLTDQIDDHDMITTEEKTQYEKRIEILEKDRENTNELVRELIEKNKELEYAVMTALENQAKASVAANSIDR